MLLSGIQKPRFIYSQSMEMYKRLCDTLIHFSKLIAGRIFIFFSRDEANRLD